ncbi:hypothetical protein ACHWQZ_G000914 [Mnemiopsis leidyi]
MADLLQKQYMSVFSDPKSKLKKVPIQQDPLYHGLDNIDFTCDEIIEAIKEIDVNAASWHDDIPAKVLNNCAEKSGLSPLKKTHNMDSDQGSGRSCFTQLLDHVVSILKNIQENKEVDVIYLNYAKAFDKVDHEIMLKKLKKMGIAGKLFEWINDFLTNTRYQTVLVNGRRSFLAEVLSGVSQGSVLGPLLFLIYINDLVDTVKGSKVSSFADDTKISRTIEYEEDVSSLQIDLDKIITWSIDNNMDLHEDKFKVLNYKILSSKLLKELPFTCNLHSYKKSKGKDLLPSANVRDLGVVLTQDCQWTTQITTMAENAKKMASWKHSKTGQKSL